MTMKAEAYFKAEGQIFTDFGLYRLCASSVSAAILGVGVSVKCTFTVLYNTYNTI